MTCCQNCFSDEFLKQYIVEHSTAKGECDSCGAEETSLIEASELAGFFHNLLSMYEEAESYEVGERLISRVQGDWSVFNEDAFDEDSQGDLLEEIANSDWDDDSGESPINANALYQIHRGWLHATHEERWEQYCSDVRDDPDQTFPFEEYLAEDFHQLSVTLPKGTTLFRARRGFKPGEYGERHAFAGDEIGAPPTELASQGRVNVKGQRVLYCTDQDATAVAEVRPARGFYVSVATMTLNREVRILDLMQPLKINPFLTETLKWDVEIQALLASFAEEMSRPLERDDDQSHYLPCQRLGDYIREAHYDGIRYPSALNPDGTNVVFFDPTVADVSGSKLVTITEIRVTYEDQQDAVPPAAQPPQGDADQSSPS